MNGCTIPYTPIAVDLWKVRQCQRVRLFFLSHVHLDQNCGLTSSWSMPIYCSPLSKKLLLQRFSLNPDVVHALDLNVPHTIPLTNNEDVTMTVTLIDANHCPGSVMFFFEGYFGRILYTGDFRYTENMITTSPFCDIISKPIDALYMDNTYCSPKCVFPPRDAAQCEILTIIEQHPKDKIVIGLRNLGKENLLIAIASHFGTMIKVSEERYKTLELLNGHEQFSITDNNCRIEVVPMMQVTQQNMDAWNSERPTIAILPTAIFTALGFLPFHGQRDTIVVPYSDHCSYAELHRFVAAVRPKSVIPIVRGGIRDPLTSSLLDRTSVECFLEYYDKTPMTNYHIPVAVLELMNQTPSRGGCGRRSGASQKADSRMKLQRPSTRKRKSNENKPSLSGSSGNTTLVPLEPKTSDTKDTDHHSNSSASERQHLEKPRGDTFSSNKNTDKTNCLPAMRSSSINAVPVTKSNSIGAKLSRCASSDRLFSSCFRPHVKLRASRVASPDLRMQLKRKATADLKRFYANTHSNLIRTRRVRLCSAHVCRTLCHGSKNCLSGNANITRTAKELSEPILEMNRGEETMYRFTDDLLRKLHSPKELQKDFETVGNFQETSSTSSCTNQRSEENQQHEKQSLCSYSTRSDRSSPTYVCRSPVVHDVSDVRLNSSEDDYGTASESTDIMDLRNKGVVMSDFPPQCLIMTPSAPQVARRSDFLQGENRSRVTNSNDFIFDPVERNLQTVVEPSFPSLSLPMQVSSAGITTFPVQVSCASIPLTMMDQYQEYQHAIAASMFQLQPGRNRMISDSNEPPSWNPLSSLVYSMKTSVDVTSLTSQGQGLERLPKRPCLEPRTTIFFDRPLNDSFHNALHGHSPAGICGRCPAEDRSPVSPADKLSQEGHISLLASNEPSVVLVTSNLCNPASESGFDDGATAFDAAVVVVEQTDVNELILENRNDERHCNATGKMALHTMNPIVEDKLPPKKNWRHRFGMSQLHKSHQEGKWLEPNGVAKLLVANGTAGNSRT